MALVRVVVNYCDACSREGEALKTYTVREAGRARKTDLCHDCQGFMERLMESGSPVPRRVRKRGVSAAS